MTEAESAPAGRSRRVSHWDRPPPPHDVRWVAGIVGRTLIVLGLLVFAFVAYQVWGTGIETARSQRSLQDEFQQLLASTPPAMTQASESSPASPPGSASTGPLTGPTADASETISTTSDAPTTAPPPSTSTPTEPVATTPIDTAPPSMPVPALVNQDLPTFQEGDAVARLQVPRMGLDAIVVAGVGREELKRGPGHYPQTPLPGQLGNAAIAGHRTTYGEPFGDIDQLRAGDEITVATPAGSFVYVVDGTRIVSPTNVEVLDTVDDSASRLTLTSCHPRYSARQRIIVSAGLAGDRSSPVGEPVIDYGRPAGRETDDRPTDTLPGEPVGSAPTPVASGGTSPVGTEPDSTGDSTASSDNDVSPTVTAGSLGGGSSGEPRTPGADADAFSQGWFADRGAYPQVAMWGLVLAALAFGAYRVCHRFRNDWSGPLVVAVPFVVVLYFFFQNVNRLLPAAL